MKAQQEWQQGQRPWYEINIPCGMASSNSRVAEIQRLRTKTDEIAMGTPLTIEAGLSLTPGCGVFLLSIIL